MKPDPTPAEDLAVLFPDADVDVRDPDTGETVTVTVRELRFLAALRLASVAGPLIEAFAAGVAAQEDPDLGTDPDIDERAVATALTEHAEAWVACLAQATGRDAGWIERLGDMDGQAISSAMWDVNAGFFGRRLVEALRRKARRKVAPSPSPKSSMPSSGPATAADTGTSPSA